MVGRVAAAFLVIQSSHAFGANAADALFFLRFGVNQLPQWIMVSGVVVMGMVTAHTVGLGAMGPRRWLPLATLIMSVWAAAGWLGVEAELPGVYAAVWASTQAIIIATITIMWNTAGASCTTRQAKRIFPLFAAAGVGGAIAGNLLTGPLAAIMGTENLLLVQAFVLLIGSILVVRAREYFRMGESSPPSSVTGELRETAAQVWRSKFLTLAALMAVGVNVLFFLVYFPFSTSVAASFDSEAEVAAFLGVFASIATLSTFLVSLLVTKRLFARLGLVLAFLIVPLAYAAGFALWLGVFTLASAALVRGVLWVATNAIGSTAYPALFNVITGRRRGEIVAFMTAVPAQIGVLVGGLLLLLVADLPAEVTFLIGLAAAVGLAVAVARIRPAYLEAVVTAVRSGVVGVFDAPANGLFTPNDADARQVLIAHLQDPRPPARAVAVTVLARLEEDADPQAIEPLLGDSDPAVRSAAFETMCAIDPARVSSHASAAIADDDADVRLNVLRYLATSPDEETRSVASASLDDPDPRVRAAAAVLVGGASGFEALRGLASGEDPRGVVAALTEARSLEDHSLLDAEPLLRHEDPAVRAAAVPLAILQGISLDVIEPLVGDPSPRVRKAAAGSLAETGEGLEVLIRMLATGSVSETEAALDAITPMSEMTSDFALWGRREVERAAFLLACDEALGAGPHGVAGAYLRRVLRMRIDRLLRWVLHAITTPATSPVMSIVERGIHSGSDETRAQAIEALEAVGDRQVISALLPLLEPDHVPGSIGESEALRRLARDFDPWLGQLARAELFDGPSKGEPGVPSYDSMPASQQPTSLSVFEKVLVLQKVPMFAELDPEDLETVAEATKEIRHEAGDPLYREGETGQEMLVIVAGSVVVSVGEGSARQVIETYGPGEHVGELALLGGGVRSADVTAGAEGAHGLVLAKHELMSVLEDRPSVTMGLLATLAKRLARQTGSHLRGA